MGLGREYATLARHGKRVVGFFTGPDVRHASAYDQQCAALGHRAATMGEMAARWADRVLVLVCAGTHSVFDLSKMHLRVGREGGIAGVYAIMRKLSGVMVGVAIATALVPPLSTVGFGLATGRMDFALGAALLFLTNTLAIAFAATIVARLNHFGPSLTPQHTAMQVVGIFATLGILSIPLALIAMTRPNVSAAPTPAT